MSDDFVDIDLSPKGEILPKKNNKVALIDADTLVFASCVTLEIFEDLLPRDMYHEEEWAEIVMDPGYDEESNCLYYINLDEAEKHTQDRIDSILEATGCQSYELHFTSGRKSFRYDIDPMYKATRRDSRPPSGIIELRQRFADSGLGYIHKDYEADDIVVALKRDNPHKYTICAVDKDVLYSLPGRHFNYYKSAQYGIDMKWIDVEPLDAMKHHYLQTLTGDSADNVPGIKGIGPKKAAKILDGLTNIKDMWSAVVTAYEDNNLTVIDAITNMRLVSMHQLLWNTKTNKYDIELWRPQL